MCVVGKREKNEGGGGGWVESCVSSSSGDNVHALTRVNLTNNRNFTFTASTVMLASNYREGEAERVQGINDFIIFFSAGIAAFSSGYFYDYFGWSAVLLFTSGCELLLAGLIIAAWTKREEVDAQQLLANAPKPTAKEGTEGL